MSFTKGKPLGRTVLDMSHPLAASMMFCPVMNEGPGARAIWDSAARRFWNWFPSNNSAPNSPSPVAPPAGSWIKATSVNGKAAYSGAPGDWCLHGSETAGVIGPTAPLYIDTSPSTTPNWTSSPLAYSVAALFKPLDTGTTGGPMRIGDSNQGNCFFYFNNPGNAGAWFPSWRKQDNSSGTSFIAYNLGDWLFLVYSIAENNGVAYCNGVSAYTQSDLSVNNQWQDNFFGTGSGNTRFNITCSHSVHGTDFYNEPVTMDLAGFWFWRDRALNPAEVAMLTANPWGMMKPYETALRKSYFFFNPPTPPNTNTGDFFVPQGGPNWGARL